MTDIQTLADHAARLKAAPLKSLAAARAELPMLSAAGWSANLARHLLDDEAEAAVIAFGEAKGLDKALSDLFSAVIVNPSENRPALHWALRAGPDATGEAAEVRDSLTPALAFADTVAERGFTHIVHIGIGGSDFGPRLIYDAFPDRHDKRLELRFCANVDPLDLDRALDGLNPKTTLVIGVSKSFGTEETLYNLGRAQSWLAAAGGGYETKNLALITANRERAEKWLGAPSDQIFDMPLSVGGRFSLWSAASLACMAGFGAQTFREILAGARAMDDHVRTSPIASNLAARLALLDYWNATIRGEPMRVVLAYASRLRMLPTYLQQLEMESNGKSVTPAGADAATTTAPAVWGGEGSIGQHSYHQWLHQGSQSVPAEFILALDEGAETDGQSALIAHCLAQAEVLANGRSFEEVKAEEPGVTDAVARQKVHPGGRPSTLMFAPDFSPERFGALVALYEHRTYLAGVLWGINSFDQWGVERGKTMAGRIKATLPAGADLPSDPVTASLVKSLH